MTSINIDSDVHQLHDLLDQAESGDDLTVTRERDDRSSLVTGPVKTNGRIVLIDTMADGRLHLVRDTRGALHGSIVHARVTRRGRLIGTWRAA